MNTPVAKVGRFSVLLAHLFLLASIYYNNRLSNLSLEHFITKPDIAHESNSKSAGNELLRGAKIGHVSVSSLEIAANNIIIIYLRLLLGRLLT